MKTKITSNVLESVSKRLQGEVHKNEYKKALIAFTGSNHRLDKKIADINILKERGIKISLAFSFMGERLLDTKKIINQLSPYNVYKEEDIFKLESISRDYAFVIGPNITINTLSKISLSLVDSFIANLIWTYLYKGKKVYLDFTSVREYLGGATENKEILNRLQSHIDTVKKMGIIEIRDGNYLEIIGKETDQKILNPMGTNTQVEGKKVITESDILSMSSNNKLILPKGSIITPLAKDKAREKNVQIEIKGG